MNAPDAPTFVYIDYGPSLHIGRELRYSLATLLAEYAAPRVLVYTDKPETYARLHPCVSARDFGDDLRAWSRAGAYNHRVKPCVLLDALRIRGGLCVLFEDILKAGAGHCHPLGVDEQLRRWRLSSH